MKSNYFKVSEGQAGCPPLQPSQARTQRRRIVGASFQLALQERSSRDIVTTKSGNLYATRYQLSVAMALRVFAMDALGGLCVSTLRWCDV